MNSSIIITTLRRPQLLAGVLHAIQALDDRDFEVVVVCDGEDDSTRAISQSLHVPYPLCWVFNRENVGLAESRNIGARNASGELLLFLDDDCIPQPGWLERHRKPHESGNCVVAGRIVDIYEREPASRVERMLRQSAQEDIDCDAALLGTERESGSLHCAGRNSSMRKVTWSELGGFDPRLRFTAEEDTEFGLRLYAAGVRFAFEPAAVVHHVMTKDPIAYLLDGAGVLARCDLYRVRDKGQRVPMMFSMYNGRRLRRWREQVAWRLPRITHVAAELCRRLVETAGSKAAFYAWQRLAFSWRYWRAMREQGVSMAEIRDLTTSVHAPSAGSFPVPARRNRVSP
jgi:GT2 family glycosyltransferase